MIEGGSNLIFTMRKVIELLADAKLGSGACEAREVNLATGIKSPSIPDIGVA